MEDSIFRYSRPYGYNPEDVEIAIKEYESRLSEKEAKILELESDSKAKDEQISNLKGTIGELQLELNMIEMPDVSSIQENYVIEKFKEENAKKHNKDYDPDKKFELLEKKQDKEKPKETQKKSKLKMLDNL